MSVVKYNERDKYNSDVFCYLFQALLLDCVKPAVESEDFVKYKSHIDTILKTIGTGLDNPFNQALRHVILTLAVCFEVSIFVKQ